MINRKELVTRHNPVLTRADTESPLSVGNGDFAFTADITGLQTLYNEYEILPLCTMSNWGWHTMPDKNGKYYTLDDVEMTHYDINGRIYEYAVEEQKGNEEIYNWLRHNPHRLNLTKISPVWENRKITSADITDIKQELELYTGVLHSKFKLFGQEVSVMTVCAKKADVIGFKISSTALSENLKISISFPYGSHKKSASDWENENRHETEQMNENTLKRILDNDVYYIKITGIKNFKRAGKHEFILNNPVEFTVAFSKDNAFSFWGFNEVLKDSKKSWRNFWENGGAVDFSRCTDERADELERRVVLSQYQLAINSTGSIPPQETGLLCNSWYGKFHLEMHPLHSAWLPLWGKPELLEKSLAWYESVLDNAVQNAARNGYKGARWVKMTGPEGVDSPSRIATLLIWQQPHIIYMLDLIAHAKPENERLDFMKRYWNLVKLTAEFMCDFVQYNEITGMYDLPPPLIPAQEEHKPEVVLNPAFELCYWRFGLAAAAEWACEIFEGSDKWKYITDFKKVGDNMADFPVQNGLYTAHQNCPDTFENFNKDHPSMLFGYGFIDYSGLRPLEDDGNINPVMMSKTIDKVLDCWDFKTMWGWDFALMAMTLARLGRAEEAVDILLKNTPKNSYVASGNNFQKGREDLPLYLPGNGSLLFALALMLAGYGEKKGIIGFPENGKWNGIQAEGIMPLSY